MNLLDVQDVNGNLYFWADRPCNAPIVLTGAIEVDIEPPVAPLVGQYISWVLATKVKTTATAYASARATATGAILEIPATPDGSQEATATFSGFQIPQLPPGAVIVAIYSVAVLSGTGSGSSDNWDGIAPSSIPDGEFSGFQANVPLSITISEIPSVSLEASIADSLTPDTAQTFQVDSVALAIYYTLSTGGEPGYYSAGTSGIVGAPYLPWLLEVPSFTFHRSLVTDMGSFVIQNLSGDTLSRDMEKLLRASALEGAFFVYRCWQPDAEAAWLEVHGVLSVEDVGVDTVTFKAAQLINPSQLDTPLEEYCETCQIQWAGRRCGSTQSTECSYSFPTCQVIERPMIVMNDYEKNFGETVANIVTDRVINRLRRI